MSLYSRRTQMMGTENAFKIGSHIARMEATGMKVIKLNIGEPDFNAPDWVKQEIIAQIQANNTKYCDPQGIVTLRQAIADQVSQSRGLAITPDQVCIFPGGKPSIAFTQQLYCNPGDEIIYPSPGFPIYESMVRYVGAVPVPLFLDESANFTFSPDQLKALITPKTKLIILNFPSNPTGGVATRNELESIAGVILSSCNPNVRVYSDEIYENIIFNGQDHLSIASVPGMEKCTLIASGFSKSYAWTGGRIGYIIAPTTQEAQMFKTMNINYFSCLPPYNQEGARVALEHPASKDWMAKMTAAFEGRCTRVIKDLNQIEGVHCQMPGGAFYAFPNIAGLCARLGIMDAYADLPGEIQEKTSISTLFQMFALYHHGVAVLDRAAFGIIGSRDQHFIRLSLASSQDTLDQGVARIKTASEDIHGFSRFIKKGKHLF